jgi:hypothetical protein
MMIMVLMRHHGGVVPCESPTPAGPESWCTTMGLSEHMFPQTMTTPFVVSEGVSLVDEEHRRTRILRYRGIISPVDDMVACSGRWTPLARHGEREGERRIYWGGWQKSWKQGLAG